MSLFWRMPSKQLGVFPFTNQYADIFTHGDIIVYPILAWIYVGLQETSDLGLIFDSLIEYCWECHILVDV